MNKKTLALVVSAIMVSCAFVGCGDSAPAPSSSGSASASTTSSSSASTASNSSASTSSTASNAENKPANTEDGKAATEVITVPVAIVNNSDVDIHELYTSGEGVDNWGDNILPPGQILGAGQQVSPLQFNIDKNNLKWDLLAKDAEGTELEFRGLDLSNCDTSGITITLTFDHDTGTGTVTAQ